LIENWAISFKAGIGINFNQPDIVMLVNHKIQTEYLEIIQASLRIDIQGRSVNGISC
jgi:translation initiation factor 6 (eIF-6)